jgi:hypothetical protein
VDVHEDGKARDAAHHLAARLNQAVLDGRGEACVDDTDLKCLKGRARPEGW